jgi:hypothetical protein
MNGDSVPDVRLVAANRTKNSKNTRQHKGIVYRSKELFESSGPKGVYADFLLMTGSSLA